MKIAEFFVNLGIKGAAQTGNALLGIKRGLGGIHSASLETKAAMLGVFYGLERLMTASAQRGQELTQFANYTGLAAEKLQLWQYAARQSGVAADEIAGSFKTVQGLMMDMLTGKGAPHGMGILARAVGFDDSRVQDTFYVMDKLKEFAKIAPAGFGNSVLKSFGLSEGTIHFLRTTKEDLDKIKPSNIYSSSEIAQLSRINIAWLNLFERIKMSVGHLNSMHGGRMVRDISAATDSVLRLVKSLVVLSEKTKIFDVISKSVDTLTRFINASSEVAESTYKQDTEKNKQERTQKIASSWEASFVTSLFKSIGMNDFSMGSPAPNAKPAVPNVTHVQVKQELNFAHEGTNPVRIGQDHKKAVNEAFRQMPSQSQVN